MNDGGNSSVNANYNNSSNNIKIIKGNNENYNNTIGKNFINRDNSVSFDESGKIITSKVEKYVDKNIDDALFEVRHNNNRLDKLAEMMKNEDNNEIL